MKMTMALTLFTAVLLAGCATQAQKQAIAIQQNNKSATEAIQACSRIVYDSPDAASLRRHLPFNINEASLEQLSDNTFATADEIKALNEVHSKLAICRSAFLMQLGAVTPAFVPILTKEFASNDDSLVDLIQAKQSWGQHVRRTRMIVSDAAEAMQRAGQQIANELNRSNEQELANRRAAAAAIAQYYQQQQLINAATRPVTTTTNCNAFGNSVTCNSVAR